MRWVAAVVLVLALAGCGGGAERAAPEQPKLPRDLAQSWAQQSDAVAGALSEGDGCTAQRLAGELQSQFVAAVNARRVPPRLQEPLGAAFADLQSRITCTPPPAPTTVQQEEPKPKEHGKHDHGRHGHGKHEGHD